jgi:spermidine synthase
MIPAVKSSIKSFILILAVCSGAAFLAYQVVWLRRLSLLFGSTTLVTGNAMVFGGMAIGTWMWSRLADHRPQSGLILFAAAQFATGLYEIANLVIFYSVTALYVVLCPLVANHPTISAGVQFVLSAVIILPPAILMGGTLPLLARPLALNDSAVAGAGAVYGWTALGSAAGAAAITYGLLPAVGLSFTVAWAAVVSVLVGIAALSAEVRSPKRLVQVNAAPAPTRSEVIGDFADRTTAFLLLIGFAVSAFAMATFEIGWVRLMEMVLGSSVYVHAAPGVVALAGVGIGSALYARKRRTIEAHQRWFALLEFMIAFAASLSILLLPRIPFLFARFFPLLRGGFGRQIAAHFIVADMLAVLPSLFFGAMLPAAIGSAERIATHLGRTIGAAYVANTTGAAIGACVAELALLPTVGVHATMNLGVLAAVCAGLLVWWHIRAPRIRQLQVLAPAIATLLVLGIQPAWPREVFAAGIGFVVPRVGTDETLQEIVSRMRLLYYHDARNATISVDRAGQTLVLRSDGRTQNSTDPIDMAGQLLLGHLPMLLHPAARDVLMVGLGTGMTAAAVGRYSVQRIDIVERERAAAQAARFFDSYTRKVLDDPRVHLIIGDGGNRLLLTGKQYDIVISDPSDLWATNASSLVTLEFYRTVGARLKRGGILAQSIHTEGLLPDDVDLVAATFHAVFPHMQIWTSAPGNLLFLGTRDSVAWDYTRLKQHYAQTHGVADDLSSAGIWHPFALFGAQVLGENESDAFTRDIGALHTDDHLVLEFRTPRSLYVETASSIAQELNSFRGPDPPTIAGFDPRRDLDADGAYLLGFCYATVGRADLAIKYMELSTTKAPGRPMFFVGLGNQYRAVGRISDARKAYERALSLDLNNLEALVSLGEIRLEEGQLDWARVLSDRALRLAPQDARVHLLIDRLQEVER